jgi:hypothetical protein
VLDGTFPQPTDALPTNPRNLVETDATPREELIHDAREVLRPSQMVQDKLLRLLKASSLPVSYATLAPNVGSRRRRRNNGVVS